MFVPFPFSSLTLSRFLRFLPPSPQFHPSPSLSLHLFLFPNPCFVSTVFLFSPLLVFSFFRFHISHREDDRFHASRKLWARGSAPLFFLPKRAVSSRGDFTKFLRCRERRHQPQPALPGRKPKCKKVGTPPTFPILIYRKHSRKWSVDF